jgi:uncharacterized protein YkwD
MSARKLLVLCCALLPGMAALEVVAAYADVAVPVTAPGLPPGEDVLGGAGPLATTARAEPAMVAAVNRARTARGRRPLRGSAPLHRSAHSYAAWMLRRDYFGHLSRIRASRGFRRVGETLAMHFGWRSRVRRTVRSWLRSPAHRALLLSRGFRVLGAGQAVGVYRGHRATTWVLHLGG